MIGGDTESHKPKWHWQRLIHVDLGPMNFGHETIGCVKACWS